MKEFVIEAHVTMTFTLEELIKQLGSLDTREVEYASSKLIEMGDTAVEALITAIEPANGRISWRAVHVLAQIPDPRWLQPMRAILTYAHPLVGHAAVNALKFHDPYILVTLCRALPFSNHMVQLFIVTALESLGSRYAIPILMETLITTGSPALRYTIIQALGNLHATEAIDLIASFSNDPDDHVKKRVRSALRKLGSTLDDSPTGSK